MRRVRTVVNTNASKPSILLNELVRQGEGLPAPVRYYSWVPPGCDEGESRDVGDLGPHRPRDHRERYTPAHVNACTQTQVNRWVLIVPSLLFRRSVNSIVPTFLPLIFITVASRSISFL